MVKSNILVDMLIFVLFLCFCIAYLMDYGEKTWLNCTYTAFSIMLLHRLKTYLMEEFLPLLVIALQIAMFNSVTCFLPIFIFTFYKWKNCLIFWLSYYIWVWYDTRTTYTTGRKIHWLKYFPMFNLLRKYFPLRLIKMADIPPDRNYLFACFPHGIAPCGSAYNLATNVNNVTQLFPGIDFRMATLEFYYYLPIVREYFMSMGGCSSNKDNLTYLLSGKPSKAVILYAGGLKEYLHSHPGARYTIVKNRRKGFIRIALQTGASLVPVFSFGEQNTYDQEEFKCPVIKYVLNAVYKLLRARSNNIKGRGFFQKKFGLLPHRRAITTVVGKPIPVPKVDNPSPALVDEYHERFYAALTELFENNKAQYDEAGAAATMNLI